MVLQRQVIDLPFGGLDTKTAKQLVQPGKTLTLQDCEFDRPMAINSRAGYTALPAVPSAAGYGLAKLRQALYLHDGNALWSWAPTRNAWGPGASGLGAVVRGVLRQPNGPNMPGTQAAYGTAAYGAGATWCSDYVECDGYGAILAVTNVTDLAYLTVIDLVTGAVVLSANVSSGNSGRAVPRLLAEPAGHRIWVLLVASGGLTATYYSTSPWTGTPTNVVLDAGADTTSAGTFDVALLATGEPAVAYKVPGVNGLKIAKFGTGGTTTTRVFNGLTPAGPIAAVAGANYLSLHVPEAGNQSRLALLDNSTLTIQGDTGNSNIGTTAGAAVGYEYATNRFRWLISQSTTSASPAGQIHSTVSFRIGFGVGISADNAATKTLWGVVPASRVFTYQGKPYFWGYITKAVSDGGTDVQPGYLLLRADTDVVGNTRLSGKARDGNGLPDSLWSTYRARFQPCSVVNSAQGYSGPRTYLIANRLGANTAPGPAEVTIDELAPLRSVESNGSLLLTGTQVYESDGVTVCEAGFHLWPEIVLATPAAAGGSLPDGTYYLRAIYRSWDANGKLTQSGVSLTSQATVTGGSGAGKITVAVTPYHMSARKHVVDLFLSTDNVVYHWAGRADATQTPEAASTMSVVLASYSASAELLYTVGGIVENDSPPSLCDVIKRGKRLYGVTPEGTIYYTKDEVAGLSPEWSAFATKDARDGGLWYQLADIDGRLVICGERAILVTSGEGIDAIAATDNLGEPQKLPTEGGIALYTPVLALEDGVWLQQQQGIHVLDRSLQMKGVGTPVDGFSAFLSVSMVNVQYKHQVRVGHFWAGFGAGTLVYDLIAEQWSQFTNLDHVSAVYIPESNVGSYYILRSDGVVWKQLDNKTTDGDDTAIRPVVETPDLHLGVLQGVQRLYWVELLGEFNSGNQFQLEIFYDRSPVADESVTFTPTGISGGAPVQFRHHSGRRCQTVRFKVTVLAGIATVTGLSLELGVRGQVARFGSSKTV